MSKEKEIRDAGMAIIKQLLEEIQSKDKEIAELNNTIIKQNREIEELLNQFNDDPFFKIATQLSEIQSLKEEVERLKGNIIQLHSCNKCKFPNCECHFK